MEQLVSLLQKKQLQKEERLKSLIKIIDKKIVKKLYSFRNQAFFKIKNYRVPNRNNMKIISEKDEDRNVVSINISNTNQIREALYQLQNYNLVQLEILKKETLCLMVSHLQKHLNKNYNHLFRKLIEQKRKMYIPYLKTLAFKLNSQSRFLEILFKFKKNREQRLRKEMKRQEAISKIVQSIQNTKVQCFFLWRKKVLQNEQIISQNTKYSDELKQFSLSLTAGLIKMRFKVLSNAFISLKQTGEKNNKSNIYVLKIKIKKVMMHHLLFGFHKIIVCSQNNNPDNQSSNADIIKNLSVISNRLSVVLGAAHQKQQQKRRNLMVYRFLWKKCKEEDQRLAFWLCKWKKALHQYNCNQRIRIIDHSQQLEDDQQLLVQQYKQLFNENAELQQMYQQVQTYFHTPTGLSVKKSETKVQQQQIYQLLSQPQQQETVWEEDALQNEDYSLQFVENIENQNVELKQKIEDQQMRRNQYLEAYERRKNELLSQLAQKRQNIQVQ